MSIRDGKRLPSETFKLDVEGMRSGWYSDHYFNNVVRILGRLSAEGYRFAGRCPLLSAKGADPSGVDVGDMRVDMQYFTKREPFSIVAGADHAIAMFKECAGYFDQDGRFVNTAGSLEIDAVLDGEKVKPWETVMRVRGRYRDFAFLETTTLGALARRTRIATNVYKTLQASGGKPIFFFPARFDLHEAQAGDGYAYLVALERYNMDYRMNARPLISTSAQGSWWGGSGSGTMAHAYVLCFLRDTAEATIQFARHATPDAPRIALVDSSNDCVGDSVATAKALFGRYMELVEAGRRDEAQKFVLYGVRADTAGNMMDKAVESTGNAREDYGVVPRLVWKMREALDAAPESLGLGGERLARAREYFRSVKIIVSGGFDPERVAWFESLKTPVDAYGIGSYFIRDGPNDFTADVVRVHVGGQWRDLAKEGRQARDNAAMKRVVWPS